MWDQRRLIRVAPRFTAMSSSTVAFGSDMSRSLPDIDYGAEGMSSGFFRADYKRHDDLAQMLDSTRDSLKLNAMKQIVSMLAKGRDASGLFPSVVKNVVSKNIEIKKLVYTYLVHYAEQKPDLALLSISTFQRALKDPNQLIRANALRVLSSIRVPVIVPIMMLAINECVMDMSPYVRKTVSHAIPKLYSLDNSQKEQLITVIEKLMADRTTLVIGSAVMAFEQVCPGRIDLVHRHYRRFCSVLVDIDEWGQVVIVNMLTRYGRGQFLDPNAKHVDQNERVERSADGGDSVSGSDSDTGIFGEALDNGLQRELRVGLDSDHRLLLRSAKPLLLSRNAAVVMTVVQLYYHLAPRVEMAEVVRALQRLTRGSREVQCVALTCVSSISTEHPGLFEPYLKSFYVHESDVQQVKMLKLEVLTNLASEANIMFVLREFQTYIGSADPELASATIQAIGRCASNIISVAETCLQGLVSLLSSNDELVVAESVIVVKHLMQTERGDYRHIIRHMARLVDSVHVPAARASLLWLIGEHCDGVSKIAPDVLRKMAKTFSSEDRLVKLQTLSLAAKVCVIDSETTSAAVVETLAGYVFQLARYDTDYDVRDRSRLLQALVFPAAGVSSRLGQYARRILTAAKPPPKLHSHFQDRGKFQLGSLSHYLNTRSPDYQDLPPFPTEASDPTVRDVAPPPLPPSVSDGAVVPEGVPGKGRDWNYSSSDTVSTGYEHSIDSDSSSKASSSDLDENSVSSSCDDDGSRQANEIDNIRDSKHSASVSSTKARVAVSSTLRPIQLAASSTESGDSSCQSTDSCSDGETDGSSDINDSSPGTSYSRRVSDEGGYKMVSGSDGGDCRAAVSTDEPHCETKEPAVRESAGVGKVQLMETESNE